MGGGCSGNGEKGVGSNGHGQHRVERVVNVLSNNVNSSRGASDERSSMSVGRLKLAEKVIPSWTLLSERRRRIDVAQGVGNGHGTGHDESV